MISEKAKKNMAAVHAQARINADSNTDEQAYETYALYDDWEDVPEGTFLKEGKKVGYKDVLYKVNAPGHNKQSAWTPDAAHSLFAPVPKNETGTIDDPITWVSGMVSEAGKYYIDEGIKYLCIEESGIGLYAQPKDLPRYFKAVE
jgi:hypothetical protein